MKYAVCKVCTLRLVDICYERTPWFRLVREPLRLSMLALGRIYRIRLDEYEVRTESCRGCPRFLKTALKDKSPFFQVMNDSIISPVFDRIMESIVTEKELADAKRHARESTERRQSNRWSEGRANER